MVRVLILHVLIASISLAAGHGLPNGSICAFDADCLPNTKCWASNSMVQKRCGNFNAPCSSDSDCAYNTCQDGTCSGMPTSVNSADGTVRVSTALGITSTGSRRISTHAMTTSTSISTTMTRAHGGTQTNDTKVATGTFSVVTAAAATMATGGVNIEMMGAAAVAGVFAWAL